MSKGSWSFDDPILVNRFESEMGHSVPEFASMRRAVYEVGERFMRAGRSVIDLGASAGGSVRDFLRVDEPGPHSGVPFYLVEQSPAMLAVLRAQAESARVAGHDVNVCQSDLEEKLPHFPVPPSLVLSVLTLQFVSVQRRVELLAECRDLLAIGSRGPGAALVLVEKVSGADRRIDLLMKEVHESFKRMSFTPSQIEAKKEALDGVLVPVTARMNEEMLLQAGFRTMDVFWACQNFRGWIALP